MLHVCGAVKYYLLKKDARSPGAIHQLYYKDSKIVVRKTYIYLPKSSANRAASSAVASHCPSHHRVAFRASLRYPPQRQRSGRL
jgi:hypothetical protein